MSTFVVPADDALADEVIVPASPTTYVVPAEGESMGRSAVTSTVLQKDPADDRVFTIDWSGPHPGPFLAEGETITAADVTVDDGIVKGDVANTDTAVTVKLSGGTSGEIYRITCSITTSAGADVERSFKVWVLDL